MVTMQTEVEPVRRHLWSVQDVLRMVDTGVLQPGERVELLDGELVQKVPINEPHVLAVNRLNMLLVLSGAGRFVVSVQNPLILDDRSMPEPDLVVLRAGAPARLPRGEDVALVVEVGDSSARSDRTRKVPRYAGAGVPELWLADLVDGALLRHTRPGPDGYAQVERLTDGEVEPSFAPGLRVPVLDVLGG